MTNAHQNGAAPTLLSTALAYQAAGRSVLPIAPGEKRPSILNTHGEVIGITWDAYQTTTADEAQIRAWFPPDRLMGIGIACGPVSGTVLDGVTYGLEILDVDDEQTLEAFIEAANFQGLSELLQRLLHQRTPGGAGHFGSLCQAWASNTVLARRPGREDAGEPKALTLIETRGAGGQAVVAPTPPGIHPEHPERGYELVRGSWEALPLITPEERQALWDLARSLNEYVEPAQVHTARGAGRPSISGNRPGDWLNRTADGAWWRDLLERHGWTLVQERRGIQYWQRPGKAGKDWSATLGACGDYFYVFSSNAAPFQPEKAYLPFVASTLLEHAGDFQAAARALIPQRFAAEWPGEAVALTLLERLVGAPEARLVHAALPTLTALSPDAWQATKSAIKRLVGDVINLSDVHTAWKKAHRPQAQRTPTTGTHPPEATPLAARDDGPLPYSDVYNARRLVQASGVDFRYCGPWGKWLLWTGTHWQSDTTEAVMDYARETSKALVRQALDTDDSKLLKHGVKSLDHRTLAAMLTQARSMQGVRTVPGDFDRDPWLLNCTNDTLDLQAGTLHPHARTDLLTQCLPVAYDRDAQCPTWEAFLDRIMAGNQNLIRFLQRAVGYALTGVIREHVLLILWGTGRNGKSTFLNTLRALLGPYAMKAPAELLLVSNNDRHPTERADLFGTRFVSTIETEKGRRLAEVFVKEATGGDPIRARRMREDFWEFQPTHKVFLATNHKPVITGTDNAIWERIRLIPFTVTIPKDERDTTLPDKLEAELPGILAWAVRGCLAWQREGLGEPDEVLQATAGYRAEMDTVGGFIAECCLTGPHYRAKADELYDAYKRWCERNRVADDGQRVFGMALTEKGYERKKSHGNWWLGIALLHEGPQSPPGGEKKPDTGREVFEM
jgi:P4 family phage/plasmid primase-like protien